LQNSKKYEILQAGPSVNRRHGRFSDVRSIPPFLLSGPAASPATFLLAHGAGAPMDSPWMNAVAALLADRGLRVARFEFGYIAARRSGAVRKPPPALKR
jgi:predicted alpha/beta-hydrolase family hydrolase